MTDTYNTASGFDVGLGQVNEGALAVWTRGGLNLVVRVGTVFQDGEVYVQAIEGGTGGTVKWREVRPLTSQERWRMREENEHAPRRSQMNAQPTATRTLKIYIAAAYARRVEMHAVRAVLLDAGHEVTSRWLDGGEEGVSQADAAWMDLEDVYAADVCLSVTNPVGLHLGNGGRHTELGYALAYRKRCVLLGEREQVFHHLDGIEVYAGMDLLLRALEQNG